MYNVTLIGLRHISDKVTEHRFHGQSQSYLARQAGSGALALGAGLCLTWGHFDGIRSPLPALLWFLLDWVRVRRSKCVQLASAILHVLQMELGTGLRRQSACLACMKS